MSGTPTIKPKLSEYLLVLAYSAFASTIVGALWAGLMFVLFSVIEKSNILIGLFAIITGLLAEVIFILFAEILSAHSLAARVVVYFFLLFSYFVAWTMLNP